MALLLHWGSLMRNHFTSEHIYTNYLKYVNSWFISMSRVLANGELVQKIFGLKLIRFHFIVFSAYNHACPDNDAWR